MISLSFANLISSLNLFLAIELGSCLCVLVRTCSKRAGLVRTKVLNPDAQEDGQGAHVARCQDEAWDVPSLKFSAHTMVHRPGKVLLLAFVSCAARRELQLLVYSAPATSSCWSLWCLIASPACFGCLPAHTFRYLSELVRMVLRVLSFFGNQIQRHKRACIPHIDHRHGWDQQNLKLLITTLSRFVINQPYWWLPWIETRWFMGCTCCKPLIRPLKKG